MNVMYCACHADSGLMHNAASLTMLWLYMAHVLRPLGMVQDEAVALGAAVMAYRKAPRPPEVSYQPTCIFTPRLARADTALTGSMRGIAARSTLLKLSLKAQVVRHTAAAAWAASLHILTTTSLCSVFDRAAVLWPKTGLQFLVAKHNM
jgi:hypothetical protein